MLHVSIPVSRCTCGQMIGDLATHYQNAINGGMEPREVITTLGINKVCCLTSIQSYSTYPLKRARYGTSSVPTEKDKGDLLKKVYRTEGRTFRVDGPASNLSEIETTAFTTVERNIPKRDTQTFTRNVPLTEAEKASENITKHPLEGIGKFDTEVSIDEQPKGNVRPFGFVKDENGETKLIDVGMGYKVPILKILFVTSD